MIHHRATSPRGALVRLDNRPPFPHPLITDMRLEAYVRGGEFATLEQTRCVIGPEDFRAPRPCTVSCPNLRLYDSPPLQVQGRTVSVRSHHRHLCNMTRWYHSLRQSPPLVPSEYHTLTPPYLPLLRSPNRQVNTRSSPILRRRDDGCTHPQCRHTR
jgi:hypothetical protein